MIVVFLVEILVIAQAWNRGTGDEEAGWQVAVRQLVQQVRVYVFYIDREGVSSSSPSGNL